MKNRQHIMSNAFLLTISETGRVTTYGYDLNGNITTLQLPNNDVTTNTYDALNRVTDKLTVSGSGVKLSGYAQRYDLVGNVVRIEETFAASADDRIIKNLYDKSYRLVGEECYHGADRQRATYYVYDYAGNRLRKEVLTSSASESSITCYTYNQLNQLLTVSGADEAEFGYDANGNRRYRTALANPPIEEEADFLVTESGDNLITENGQNIIIDFAAKNNYLTINHFIPEHLWTKQLNETWIQNIRAQGYIIADIGPDFIRRSSLIQSSLHQLGRNNSSLMYNMERTKLKGHENYFQLFERIGKFESTGNLLIDNLPH